MAEKNSVLLRQSRYVSGGVTEVNDFGLEWWERKTFTPSETDRIYVVEKKYEGRIDLIAAAFLDEPRYWWIIAMYNNILDPYVEVREGVILQIPTAERAKSFVGGNTGGVRSTREVPPSILPIV